MHWNTGQLLRPLKVQSRAPVKVTQSCLTSQPHGLHSPWNSPGQNIGVHSLLLLQGILPTQGLNPGLPHCRQILYQLSHKGSPRKLEWVAYPFSSGFPQPRNRMGVSFTNWAIREACIVHQKNYGILFFISFLNDKFLILYTITLEINVQYEWLYKK